MVNEQIKKEIDLAVEKKLNESLSVYNLPLKTKYKVLLWTGVANSTPLTPQFNFQDIEGKVAIIKSIRIVPYYNVAGGGIDFWFFDGVTNSVETVPNTARILRIFDRFSANGTVVNFTINNTTLPILNDVATIGFPLDTTLDNIFYKHPSKIQSISMSVLSTIYDNLQTSGQSNPSVKVVVECYLI